MYRLLELYCNYSSRSVDQTKCSRLLRLIFLIEKEEGKCFSKEIHTVYANYYLHSTMITVSYFNSLLRKIISCYCVDS